MSFRSKIEANSFVLLQLKRIKANYPKLQLIDQVIEKVKIALENHEQDPAVICGHLKPITDKLKSHDKIEIEKLIQEVKESKYHQPARDKFINVLARRLESEIALQLLFNPTKAMMTAVERVSLELVKLLDDLAKLKNQAIFKKFRRRLQDDKHEPINCGAFNKVPSYETIRNILIANDPKNLVQIMFLHFRISRILGDEESVINNAPIRKPIGKLAEIIKGYYEDKPELFFSDGIKQKSKLGGAYRSSIMLEIYSSPLYKAEGGKRGRAPFLNHQDHYFGLMLPYQKEYAVGFPQGAVPWSADCQCQIPNMKSQYVKDLIQNDAVYVAGPSGMTAGLLGQMEVIANFEKLSLKQNYLSAVVSYIVGGGFHSIHEVIGPAEFVLNLVPGYQVTVPVANQKAAPPNYHVFYKQQSNIDPEFSARRTQAWENYLVFFKTIYMPKHLATFIENKVESKMDGGKIVVPESKTDKTKTPPIKFFDRFKLLIKPRQSKSVDEKKQRQNSSFNY